MVSAGQTEGIARGTILVPARSGGAVGAQTLSIISTPYAPPDPQMARFFKPHMSLRDVLHVRDNKGCANKVQAKTVISILRDRVAFEALWPGGRKQDERMALLYAGMLAWNRANKISERLPRLSKNMIFEDGKARGYPQL